MNKQIDITGVRLETERLILRNWEQTDLDDLFEYAKVDGVGQMAGWLPHVSTKDSQFVLDMFINEKKTFAIEDKETGKVIGSVGLEEYKTDVITEFNDKYGREIGFVLSKAYWGRGLMPEAVKEVMRWLFEEQKLDVIFCSHLKDNLQSKRVQEKCGFKFYKNFALRAMSKDSDDVYNFITREMWEN